MPHTVLGDLVLAWTLVRLHMRTITEDIMIQRDKYVFVLLAVSFLTPVSPSTISFSFYSFIKLLVFYHLFFKSMILGNNQSQKSDNYVILIKLTINKL